MKGAEFIRAVKKLGRKRGVPVTIKTERGKGDHVTLYYGSAFTIVGDRGELKTGTLHGMLKHLGLKIDDLR